MRAALHAPAPDVQGQQLFHDSPLHHHHAHLHLPGIVGEIYNGDEFETQAEVVKIILDEIQPLLIGKDAFNVEGCWEAMRKPSYNILRDRKLAMCAQACVDSALWDTVGKALDTPLYKLWGGYRDKLPVICIAGYYEENKTLADFGREMEQIRATAIPAANSRSAAAPRRRTPNASALREVRCRRRFRAARRRKPGLEPARGGGVFAPCRGPQHPLVRGAGALAERPAGHGGGPHR